MEKRIIKFENILDETEKILNDLEKVLDRLKENQKNYNELKQYYGSEEYIKDVDLDNTTDLYKNIKRGVLSEDAVYNLIGKSYDMYIQMIEVATLLLKQH
ncbi:MAG: DUF4298 domain-containing protein [Erysipelotrichaceae bacterium]|nr:DUF4298 domain-containing protein [Erysipelotrichaceae bacterium]